MPARTGKAYMSGLRDRAAEIYIGGERVKDVTTHPAFRNAIILYDLYDREPMTYWVREFLAQA